MKKLENHNSKKQHKLAIPFKNKAKLSNEKGTESKAKAAIIIQPTNDPGQSTYGPRQSTNDPGLSINEPRKSSNNPADNSVTSLGISGLQKQETLSTSRIQETASASRIQETASTSRILVKNLPKYMTKERLLKHFSKILKNDSTINLQVTDLKLVKTKSGTFRRFAYIGYKTGQQGLDAIHYFNHSFIDTCKCEIEVAKPVLGRFSF